MNRVCERETQKRNSDALIGDRIGSILIQKSERSTHVAPKSAQGGLSHSKTPEKYKNKRI